MNGDTIIIRPSPGILEDMIAVTALRGGDVRGQAELRACAWNSLLRLRRLHGSLAEARRAAELRVSIAIGQTGRAS